MKVFSRTACVVALLLAFPMSLGAQPRYKLGYAGFAGFQVSMWAVEDLGLLKKYGLEGETVLVRGTARQVQALVGDSLQFAHVDASGFIRAVTQGADIVMIGGSLNKFPFSFVAQKEIRKPADLVGKKIGIVGFGGANDLAVTLLLREWKIPRKSVTVFASGGGAERLAALSTKALDATVLSHPELGEALRMGMNEMGKLDELKAGDYPMVAVAVRRAFLERNRDTVKRFMRAYAEASHQFMANKERGVAIYKKRLKQDNPKALEETYGYFAPKFSYPPRVSRNGLRNTLEIIHEENPKVDMNLAKYLDESVLDELEKEGFFKSLSRR